MDTCQLLLFCYLIDHVVFFQGRANLSIHDMVRHFMINHYNNSDSGEYDEYLDRLRNKTLELMKPPGEQIEDDYDSLRRNLFGVAVILCVFTVVFNCMLLLVILTSRRLRTKPLFWNIISLTVSDLIVGLFILPIRLDYTDSRSWDHGITICKIWSVMDISHFSLSAMVVVSICSERILAKMETLTSIGPDHVRMLSMLVTVLPWGFLTLICLPVLIVGEENINWTHENILFEQETHCTYILEASFFVPSVAVTYLLPAGILLVLVIAMVIVYVTKRTSWERLVTNTTDAERRSLRMSTTASLVVGMVTIIFWFPHIVLLLIYITCRDFSCMPDQSTFAVCYMLSISTSALSPFIWLLIVEVRETLASEVNPIVHKIHTRLGFRSKNIQREHNTELLVDNDL